MFVLDVLFDLFPVHAKGWIRQHVVKLIHSKLVIRQRVPQFNPADILTFNEHVGFTDSVGFWIEFLTKRTHHRIRVQLMQIFHTGREEATRPRSRVINGTDNAIFGQYIIIFHKDQCCSQTYNVTRGKVFPGRFIGTFSKTTDQFFKHQTHVMVGYALWTQIRGGKLLHDFIQKVGIIEEAHKFDEVKVFKNLTGIFRETLHISAQVGLDITLPHFAEIHWGGIKEG